MLVEGWEYLLYIMALAFCVEGNFHGRLLLIVT
jgi:hypothetical protein